MVRQTPLLDDCEVAGGRLGGTRRGGRPKRRRQRPEFRKEPRRHQAKQRPIQSAEGSRAKRRYLTRVDLALACRAEDRPKQAATQGIPSFGFAGLALPPPWAKNAPHRQANAISPSHRLRFLLTRPAFSWKPRPQGADFCWRASEIPRTVKHPLPGRALSLAATLTG